MWALSNRTPYAADRAWMRAKDGSHLWLIAIKGTFEIDAEGGVTIANEQRPVLLAPEYVGEPGRSSLRYDSDLTLPKPTTDVVLGGQAYAPGGSPAASVRISLSVGAMRKALVVHGERVYQNKERRLAVTRARPFVSQPLLYERTFGGTDITDPDPSRHACEMRNPVGRGFAIDAASLDETLAPNIEYPAEAAAFAGVPAGFGPIAGHWSPRLELAGTYDAHRKKTRRLLLAENYDERFVQCAPSDQQMPAYLQGGESVELENLTPYGGMGFALPTIRFACVTEFGRRREEHPCRLATVILEPDCARLTLVWQTSLRVAPTQVDRLDRTLVRLVDGSVSPKTLVLGSTSYAGMGPRVPTLVLEQPAPPLRPTVDMEPAAPAPWLPPTVDMEPAAPAPRPSISATIVQPFAPAPPPRGPAAAPAAPPGKKPRRALSVKEHARMKAEIETFPEREADIRTRYGVASDRARKAEDEWFRSHIENNPDTLRKWRALVDRYKREMVR